MTLQRHQAFGARRGSINPIVPEDRDYGLIGGWFGGVFLVVVVEWRS